MFKFCSLYSGSSGNSLLVKSDNTNILIDAGVSCKKIENGLEDLGVKPEDIDAVLITHEHTDHVQGLGTFVKKHKVPIFVNQETLDSMPKQRDKIPDDKINTFKVSDYFEVNDLKIVPFEIPHDAANPCGFSIFYNDKKMCVATDIGDVNKNILKNLEDSDFVLLESNYDPEVLKYAPYPYHLKTRISSPIGHLSNNMAGKTISYLLQGKLKQAMLGHLSKHSNFPELAYKTVVEELMKNNQDESSLKLSVASRDAHSKIIDI